MTYITMPKDSARPFGHKGGDIVIAFVTGSDKGQILTAYGSSGIKGESGAKAVGGLPWEPGPAIAEDMIVNGKIPMKGGGFFPPATKIIQNN